MKSGIQLKKSFRKQSGSVLLLALLVMSTIMAASVGLASIVISEIRQSRSIDNAILAYYGAESGVEESLYKIRKEGKPIDDLVVEKELSNGVEWYIESDDISNMVNKISVPELKKDRFIEIDIYNPDSEERTDIKYLELILLEKPLEKADFEISWFGWEGGILSDYKTIFRNFSLFNLDEEDGFYKYRIDLAEPSGAQFAYRIKIKALYNNINFLEIKAYDGIDGEQVDIPARIQATVRGEYRGSRQSIDFEMPRQSPLGGLFDFVLFSEKSILKGASD